MILLANGPRAGKAEAFAQPKHGLEAADRAASRVERAKATDLQHETLHREMIALDALSQMLRDLVERRPG